MHDLKGAIISLTDVLAVAGKPDETLFLKTVKLLKFLISRGIQPVLISNSRWTLKQSKKEFHIFLSEQVGQELPYYQGGRDIPYKQKAGAVEAILKKHGWATQEVVYVGNTIEDMRSANNGKVLFLNAKWHKETNPYGFEFSSPKDLAKFIDCCCLTPKDWFWAIEHDDLRVYAIAPLGEYSKQYPDAAVYSTNAKNAAKFDKGNVRFWGLLMAARIHMSGVGAEAQYACPYPGHAVDSEKAEFMNAIEIVSGSLSAQYLKDLITRHSNALKSQTLRNQKKTPTPANQLNSIHLRPDPVRTGPKALRYKNPPSFNGKTILVVDDICTQGFSLEAARAYIEATGGKVILLSWLKTPGPNDYHQIVDVKPELKMAYKPFAADGVKIAKHNNSSFVKNPNAAKEIADAFSKFANWEWPKAI